VKSASKLPDEETRERARCALDGLPAHEQCIDLHIGNTEVRSRDPGHFALETQGAEIAHAITGFPAA
jgi:hypothetical protein